ncbi:MAG: TRAP transporter small permease [Betaproteobacteria bacterium]|nr:MAG: TRAP transporter small permease [Betaproteobacteria bacterium]
MSALKRVDEVIITSTSWLVAYLTLQMCLVVLLGVFTRYVLNNSLAWTEELARYSMMWLSWLGGGLALRRGSHIAVEFLTDALPPSARAVVVLAGRLGVFFFLGVCLWYGADLTSRVSMQSTIALGISMQVPYAAIPVGSFMMAYHLLALMAFPWARTERSKTEVQV